MSRVDNPLTMDEALAGRKVGFSNSGVLMLNVILSVVQLSSYATGYDGSMMSMSERSTTAFTTNTSQTVFKPWIHGRDISTTPPQVLSVS